MDARFGSTRFPDNHPIVELMSVLEDMGIVKPMHGSDYDFNDALNRKKMILPDKVIDAIVVAILALALLSGKVGI